MNELKVTRFFPLDRESLFGYWVEPLLLERWAYPEGMNLKVPVMEPRANGKYRFELRGPQGLYICNGHFENLVPNEKLVQVDTVKDSEGRVIFDKLKCTTIFRQVAGGTEVTIIQNGFPDEKSMKECEKSWYESLDKLVQLFHRNIGRERPGESITF